MRHLFLHHLKISENQRFSDVFRGYRKRLVAWNELQSVYKHVCPSNKCKYGPVNISNLYTYFHIFFIFVQVKSMIGLKLSFLQGWKVKRIYFFRKLKSFILLHFFLAWNTFIAVKPYHPTILPLFCFSILHNILDTLSFILAIVV